MTLSETQWVEKERAKVVEYIHRNVAQYAGIGEWPAFHIDPIFAIWAIESVKHKGSVGFWTFSGDIPTDAIGRNWDDKNDNPRKALARMIAQWESYLPYLAMGQSPPGILLGTDEVMRKEMADSLQKRTAMLKEWASDDSLWDDDCELDA